jgi:hypothetical protein
MDFSFTPEQRELGGVVRASLHLRKARADRSLFGTPVRQRAALASLLGI